jgi:hypothetical protein
MDRVHAHLRAYLEAVASLPGGDLRVDGGIVRCTAPIGWPMFNGVLAIPRAGSCDAAAAVAGELAAHGRPWFWWVLPDTPSSALEAAAAAGASAFDDRAPWMEARIADLPEPTLPEGATVEEVTDEAGYRLWARTLREIYAFPEDGERSWVEPARLLGWRDLPWRQWIAFLDDEPVAITLMFCGGGVAGLFGLVTKPSARRRGFGRLMTLHPLKQADEELAGFFSTPDGDPLYRSLGFVQRGWVSRWLGAFERPDTVAAARGAASH